MYHCYQFVRIQFDKIGRIVSAKIEKYLLEKTRVIHQIAGERNFHIFYQILHGFQLADLNIDGFNYLTNPLDNSKQSAVSQDSYKAAFEQTCMCLSSVGIDVETQNQLFSMLIGLLHLGNTEFVGDVDNTCTGITEISRNSFKVACNLLGLNEEEFLVAIEKRNMQVNGMTIVKPQSVLQAVDKRDSFAKCVYFSIFSWLVNTLNVTLLPEEGGEAWGFIGVLDIYGFENFENANGFEQLCM